MRQEMKNILVVGSVLTVALILLVVSLKVNPVEVGSDFDEYGTFSSIEEIRSFLDEHASESTMYYGMGRGAVLTEESGVAPAAADAEKGGSDSYSQTNIQVEGVDEPDIVKNDGKYIYAVSGNKVVIVDAYPAENMEVVEEIDFDKDYVQNIFVEGDKMVVIVGHYEYVDTGIRCGEMYWGIRCGGYSKEETVAYIYDITDRSKVEKEKEISVSGNYVNARMIDNVIYLISSKYIYSNSFELPSYRIDGTKSVIAPEKIYYFDQNDNQYVFNTIAAINIEDGEFESETYLMGSTGNIYVSPDNIYLTYMKQISQEEIMERYLEEVLIPHLPRDVAREVEGEWNGGGSVREREEGVSDVLNRYFAEIDEDELFEFQSELEEDAFDFFSEIQKEQERTVIHRIAIDGLEISHEASGEVAGRTLNQFSMDENGETFRIATTTGGWDVTENENNLYVMNLDLEVIGELEGLAEGEQIYSARFMGDKAYLVTFRQTDPLFAIDLSEPSEPRVLGELKVTGYSGYLHPYDEDHLLGIGMEASEEGRVEGVKVSLFDVSDVENPREIGKYEIEEKWSNSEATYDHKAVLFDRERGLLVIPVSYTKEYDVSGQSWPRYENWQGAYVFDVDLNGVELRGKVAHTNEKEGEEYWYGGEYVRRALYIDDVLYTVSSSKIKANELEDLSAIKEVELPHENYYRPHYAEETAVDFAK